MILYNYGLTVPFLQILLGGLTNMKTFWKRLLAVSLSAALLIGCAVSGLVLPAAAAVELTPSASLNLFTNGDLDGPEWSGNDKIVTVKGYDDNDTKAFRCTASDGVAMPSVTLKTQGLIPGKLYILRYKVTGGKTKVYGDPKYTGGTSATIGNATLQAEMTANGWAEFQLPFQATDAMADITTFSVGKIYNQNANPVDAPIYCDDFELYEYVPGMNLMSGADGTLLPGATGYNADKDFFQQFIAKGTTFSLYNDNGNSVWKLTNVPTEGYYTYGNFLHAGYNNPVNLWTSSNGKQFTVSFRYKSAVEGAEASVKLGARSANNLTVSDEKYGTADANTGWKTASAKLSTTNANTAYFLTLKFTGAKDVYIDDFFFGETFEAQIEQEAVTIEEGKTVQLNATATPTGTPITWTSSDDDIATVDNSGVVTGHKAGKVTITASVENGWDDTCEVTVTKVPADPTPEESIEDFSIEMLGLAIHYLKGEEANKENADGVRFGARLYFGEGFPTLNADGELQLPYGGEYCDVVSVGTILRRHTEGDLTDLTLGTEEWIAEAYSNTTNKLKCITQADTYIDFAVNMMKGEKVSTETFNARNYDARGYVRLSNGEVIYTTTVTNGIEAYYATRPQ